MTDERLRDAYQQHVLATTNNARVGCPTVDEIATAVAAPASDAARLDLLSHVLGCARCHAEFELLRATAVATDASAREETVSTARTGTSVVRWRWIGLAAALLVSVGIGRTMWRDDPTPVSRANDTASSDTRDVQLIAPRDGWPSPVAELVWHAMPQTSAYVVDVLDTTGVVLLTAITSDTTLPVSPRDRARLDSAGAFDWFVTSRRLDGNERRSELVRVRRASATEAAPRR